MPTIPDRPAGRALGSWLEVFNAGGRARIDSYDKKHFPAVDTDRAKSSPLAELRHLALADVTVRRVSPTAPAEREVLGPRSRCGAEEGVLAVTPVASVDMDRDAPSCSTPSDYREFPVPEPLAPYFLCLWTQSISAHGEYAHRVLPDACADILCLNEKPPVVVGPWTAPFIARLPAGTWIVGARLHPGRASSWLGVSAAELLNRTVPLRLLRGSRTSSLFTPIAEQADLTSRRSALAAALLGCVAFTRPFDRAVSAGIAWIGHYPHGRVEQLSRWIGVSDRQLRRRFASSVGYGPKTLQSILRFQRLLSFAASRRSTESLAALALDAGYADQAHMTREVRRFADHAPSALLGSTPCTLEMSDLFKMHDGAREHSLQRDA